MVLVIGEVVVELDIVGEDRGVMGIESDRFDVSAVVRVGGVVSKIVRRGLETQRWRGGARDKDGGWFRIWCVTNLQGPPSERTPEEKLWDFKTRAQQYARDRESCDDVRISYLEFLETEAEEDLALARMIAG
jgi:hypothetical protein